MFKICILAFSKLHEIFITANYFAYRNAVFLLAEYLQIYDYTNRLYKEIKGNLDLT